MTPEQSGPRLGAKSALILLLAINLCNYIDRYVLAAVEPSIRAAFFAADDPNAMGMTGMLAPAFLITYMLSAPALGWMADRFSRWLIVGVCVIFWSLATAAGGLAATFAVLFITRIFVASEKAGTDRRRRQFSPTTSPCRSAAESWRSSAPRSRSAARSVTCLAESSMSNSAGGGLSTS
jgi:MFS family permease